MCANPLVNFAGGGGDSDLHPNDSPPNEKPALDPFIVFPLLSSVPGHILSLWSLSRQRTRVIAQEHTELFPEVSIPLLHSLLSDR